MPSLPLRKSAAQGLLDIYGQKLDDYMNNGQYSIEGISGSLEAMREDAETVALSMYDMLGYSGGLEECERQLSNKIKELQQDTAALNGIDLQQIFLETIDSAVTFSIDQQKKYEDFLSIIKASAESSLDKSIDEDEVFDIVRSAIKYNSDIQTASKNPIKVKWVADSKTGKMRLRSGGKFAGQFGNTFSQLSKYMTSKVQKYWEDHPDFFDVSTSGGSSSDNTMTQEWILKEVPVESLLKMTKVERQGLFAEYPNLKETINQTYRQKILNACSVSNKYFLERAIDKVLSTNDEALWGATTNNMAGVLGEIQAIYYMLVITNGKNDIQVDWIGKRNDHADVVFKRALESYGIQVKNSSYEISKREVYFQKFATKKPVKGISYEYDRFNFANTDEAIANLSKLAPYDLFYTVETLLGMDTFNVEYKWKNGVAIEESNDDFHDVRQIIEHYAQRANQLAQLFSASMMYMQTSGTTSGGSNTLYLIAGSTVVSAATILGKIVKEINNTLHSFNLRMVNTYKGKQRTIADYFNSKDVRDNLAFTLQSSFTFT